MEDCKLGESIERGILNLFIFDNYEYEIYIAKASAGDVIFRYCKGVVNYDVGVVTGKRVAIKDCSGFCKMKGILYCDCVISDGWKVDESGV